jgi:hypothetical protein
MSKKNKPRKDYDKLRLPGEADLIRDITECNYNPDWHPELARRLALLKLDTEEIASVFGVCGGTLNLWKQRYPELATAIDAGGLAADSEVVDALYKRALGYKYREEHVTKQGDIVEVNRQALPDVEAIKYYLSRRSQKWKDDKQTNNIKISIAQQAESINQLFGLQIDPDKLQIPDITA